MCQIIVEVASTAKAALKQVGHLDEERAAVAAEFGLELPGKWTEAIFYAPNEGLVPNSNYVRERI